MGKIKDSVPNMLHSKCQWNIKNTGERNINLNLWDIWARNGCGIFFFLIKVVTKAMRKNEISKVVFLYILSNNNVFFFTGVPILFTVFEGWLLLFCRYVNSIYVFEIHSWQICLNFFFCKLKCKKERKQVQFFFMTLWLKIWGVILNIVFKNKTKLTVCRWISCQFLLF